MKKLFCILSMFLFFIVTVSAAAFKVRSTVYVSVKSAVLKDGTGSLSKKISQLSYGDSLIIIESNEKNSKVSLSSDSSVTGWISNSVITSRKIVKSNSTMTNASSNELALAGKGWSEEAEKAFKSSDVNLNYQEVDRIEKINVSDKELADFIQKGHLNGE